jgi:hypothetical protein
METIYEALLFTLIGGAACYLLSFIVSALAFVTMIAAATTANIALVVMVIDGEWRAGVVTIVALVAMVWPVVVLPAAIVACWAIRPEGEYLPARVLGANH